MGEAGHAGVLCVLSPVSSLKVQKEHRVNVNCSHINPEFALTKIFGARGCRGGGWSSSVLVFLSTKISCFWIKSACPGVRQIWAMSPPLLAPQSLYLQNGDSTTHVVEFSRVANEIAYVMWSNGGWHSGDEERFSAFILCTKESIFTPYKLHLWELRTCH